MPFDPISWALGFVLTEGTKAQLEKFRSDRLTSIFDKELKEWAADLPEEFKDFIPDAFFSLHVKPTSTFDNEKRSKRTDLRDALIKEGVPSTSIWKEALIERWYELRNSQPRNCLQMIYRLEQSEVDPHFENLSERLESACRDNQDLFQKWVYHCLNQLSSDVGIIREKVKFSEDNAKFYPAQKYKGPVNDVPSDLLYYTGRNDELKELEGKLLQLGHPPIVIYGVGGVGKSALAKHFIANNNHNFPDGIFWINVDRETPKQVATYIGTLMRMGRDIPNFRDDEHAHAFICQLLDGKRALLVLDNADHQDVAQRVKNMLPGQQSLVAVLITTRQARLSELLEFSEDDRIDLQSFTPKEAISHFGKVLGDDHRIDKELTDLRKILGLIGHLPLLTDMLAKTFKKRKKKSFASFLKTDLSLIFLRLSKIYKLLN